MELWTSIHLQKCPPLYLPPLCPCTLPTAAPYAGEPDTWPPTRRAPDPNRLGAPGSAETTHPWHLEDAPRAQAAFPVRHATRGWPRLAIASGDGPANHHLKAFESDRVL